MTTKKFYKYLMGRLRIEKKTNRARLVNILINLKSQGFDVYNENRAELKSISLDHKVFDGDIRWFFQNKYGDRCEYVSRYGKSAYDILQRHLEATKEGLPF